MTSNSVGLGYRLKGLISDKSGKKEGHQIAEDMKFEFYWLENRCFKQKNVVMRLMHKIGSCKSDRNMKDDLEWEEDGGRKTYLLQ